MLIFIFHVLSFICICFNLTCSGMRQVVVIIGRGSSSHDISREVSKLAKEVHMASRATDFVLGKLNGHDNIWQHLMINHVQEDGLVTFDDGSTVVADMILHCTGYDYSFPFLKGNEIVRIDDNRVQPLFKHIFLHTLHHGSLLLDYQIRLINMNKIVSILLKLEEILIKLEVLYLEIMLLFYLETHDLAFIFERNSHTSQMLHCQAIIFLMIELQSRWVAKVLSGRQHFHWEEDMIASVKERYVKMEEMQRPVHHTHYIAPDEPEYLN
ncbi:hypothetical protein HPP92_015111 [Vanilla planifolia]|uniref:Flavin-containing monooxygenase n=1 Tax=Vanilla planifolia TaxID=51239 RepID=A0A835QIK4_VANPL|nr:hypothetical protein HPP92_015111 [Vanilla planifolia]